MGANQEVTHPWSADCKFCREEAFGGLADSVEREANLNRDKTQILKKTPLHQDSDYVRQLQLRKRMEA